MATGLPLLWIFYILAFLSFSVSQMRALFSLASALPTSKSSICIPGCEFYTLVTILQVYAAGSLETWMCSAFYAYILYLCK